MELALLGGGTFGYSGISLCASTKIARFDGHRFVIEAAIRHPHWPLAKLHQRAIFTTSVPKGAALLR
jgi:hypothetical protein